MRLLHCLCLCAALSAPLASAAPAASISIHHHRRQHHQDQQPVAQDESESDRHRYSIEGNKDALDAALATMRGRVDVRNVQLVSGGGGGSTPVVRASVFGSAADVAAIVRHEEQQQRGRLHGKSSARSGRLQATKATVDEAAVIQKDRKEVKECLNATDGYLDAVVARQLAAYADSAFFDCFRPAEQVFAFLDLIAEQNADVVTKVPNASVTFEGRAIPAYRVSWTGAESPEPKRALYTQSLIHAREWQAGSSTLFAMAALVDGLLAGDVDALWVLERFDWYFVPVVNIDGYIYSWEVDRMWRTNRDMVDGSGHGVPGVDLNRNFPPEEHFNENPADVDAETHPGDFPLSEPSTAGLFAFIQGINGLAGIVDMHTFGALVLRPFSFQKAPPPEPFGDMIVTLGDGVRDAMSTDPAVQYTSEPGGYLYEAFGCFDDGMFTAYNFTVPAITIEVEGDDFMVPQETIRSVGGNIYAGLKRFAEEAFAYAAKVEEL